MKKEARKLQIHRETLLQMAEAEKVQGGGTYTCSVIYWCQSVSYCVVCKVP